MSRHLYLFGLFNVDDPAVLDMYSYAPEINAPYGFDQDVYVFMKFFLFQLNFSPLSVVTKKKGDNAEIIFSALPPGSLVSCISFSCA